jgi:hypothetical protein
MKLKSQQYPKTNNTIKILRFLSFIYAILILASCSKENAEDPKTFQYRVKEERDSNNKLLKSFQYNDRNQVVSELNENGELITLYLYNTAGFLTNKGNSTLLYDYILDANGRVLEEIERVNGSSPEFKKVFVYNAAGLVIEEKNYRYMNSDYLYSYNTLLYYNSNNLLVQRFTPEHTSIGAINPTFDKSEEYEYDERGNQTMIIYKSSPVTNGNLEKTSQLKYIYDNIKPAFYTNSTLSKNNPIELVQTVYSPNGSGDIDTQITFTVNYSYNEAGYITKKNVSVYGVTNYILEKIN